MTKTVTKFEFDKFAKAASALSVGIVEEALASPAFCKDVEFKPHRTLIAWTLLTHHRPDLLGVLAAVFERDGAAAATAIASEALEELRQTDPTLFWNSRTGEHAGQCLGWLRRAFPGRNTDELTGVVSRACGQQRIALRIDCAHRIAERGEDVEAVRSAIEAAHALNAPTLPTVVAPALTDGGKVAGVCQPRTHTKIGG